MADESFGKASPAALGGACSTRKVKSANLTALITIGLAGWLLVSSLRAATGDLEAPRLDFGIYYNAARRVSAGFPLYAREQEDLSKNGYVYSPALAVILQPLAALPFPRACRIWCSLNIAAIFVAAVFFIAATEGPMRRSITVILVLLSMCRFFPIQENLVLGQIIPWLFALVGAMFWATARRYWKLLGIMIGISVLVKTWMIGFAIYFLLRRAYAGLVVCGGVVVAGLVTCFTRVGWREWHYFLRTTAIFSQKHDQVSQSVFGVARTYFFEYAQAIPVMRSPVLYAATATIGAGLVVLGFLAVARHRKKEASQTRAQLELGFVIVSVLLLLPMCQAESFVFCLPLLWIFFSGNSLLPRLSPIWAAAVYYMWTRVWGTGFIPFTHAELVLPRSLLLGTGFAGLALLWAVTFIALERMKFTSAGPT